MFRRKKNLEDVHASLGLGIKVRVWVKVRVRFWVKVRVRVWVKVRVRFRVGVRKIHLECRNIGVSKQGMSEHRGITVPFAQKPEDLLAGLG